MNKERTTMIMAFIAIYFIWGSTYAFNKILLEQMPPFQLAGIRFSIAGIIIFIMAILRGTSLKLDRKKLMNSLFAGFLFLTLGNGAVVYGLKHIDSSFAALLISSQPLILLLLLLILKGQKIVLKSIIGVILGMLGIALLTYDQGISGTISWEGISFVFLALLSWGYGSIFVGSASLPKNQFVSSAYQMFFAGISLLSLSFFFGESHIALQDLTMRSIGSMIYLIFFGSIIAFTSFNYLLTKVSPEKVATSTYINPLVALLLGWFLLDERISWLIVLATVILLSGVYFINVAKSQVNNKPPKP